MQKQMGWYVVDISYIGGKIILYPQQSVGGIAVSIAAFQAVDPGSIPGWRIFPKIYFQKSTSTILSLL